MSCQPTKMVEQRIDLEIGNARCGSIIKDFGYRKKAERNTLLDNKSFALSSNKQLGD